MRNEKCTRIGVHCTKMPHMGVTCAPAHGMQLLCQPDTQANSVPRGPIVNNLTGVPGEKWRGKRGRPFIHHTHKIPPPLFMERITLSARDFEYFLYILDNPPPPSPRLRRLLTEPSIFDTEEGTLQTLQWAPPHHRTNTPSRSRT